MIETRTQIASFEVRDDQAEGDGNKLVGCFAKYNVESLPLTDKHVNGGKPFVEVIAPGAFTNTLKDPDIRALYNHNTDLVLGRTTNGTLTLTDTEEGVAFEVELPDTSYARDVKALVARGDVSGCSFGFSVVEDEIVEREDDYPLRTLKEVTLFEISPAVCFPAYEATDVSVRSKEEPIKTPIRDLCERRLKLTFDF